MKINSQSVKSYLVFEKLWHVATDYRIDRRQANDLAVLCLVKILPGKTWTEYRRILGSCFNLNKSFYIDNCFKNDPLVINWSGDIFLRSNKKFLTDLHNSLNRLIDPRFSSEKRYSNLLSSIRFYRQLLYNWQLAGHSLSKWRIHNDLLAMKGAVVYSQIPAYPVSVVDFCETFHCNKSEVNDLFHLVEIDDIEGVVNLTKEGQDLIEQGMKKLSTLEICVKKTVVHKLSSP